MKKTCTRIALMILALVMALSCLTACGGKTPAAEPEQTQAAAQTAPAEGFPDYSNGFPETVTIQIPVYDRGYEGWNPTDNYYTRWIQENFGKPNNINVEFVAINRTNEVQDYMQMIAAHTAPDIIFHYDMPQAVNYFGEGALQDLNYEELAFYAPGVWEEMKDTIETYGAIDGHNVFLFTDRTPCYYSYVTLIRKDWCDAVGMDVPTSWEELNAVAEAWKEAGLGTLGDSLITKSFTYMASWIDPACTKEELALYFDLNVAPFTWDATERYLRARNAQYNAGTYDPEFYLTTDDAAWKSKFVAGEVGTYAFYMSSGTDVFDSLLANDPNAQVACLGSAYLPAEGYKSNYYQYPPYGMIMGISVDTPAEERAAVYMYLDWINQPENLLFLQFGVEGETYTMGDDGIALRINGYEGEAKLSQNNNKDYWCLGQEVMTYGDEKTDLIANKVNLSPAGYDFLIQDQYEFAKSREDNGLLIPVFTKSIASSSEYGADLKALWKEAYVDCITCSVEEFDARYAEYCEEYLDAGYQEILDEKQALIDEGLVIYSE